MKGGRQQRGTFIGLKMQIRGLATPVPRQWGKYLANPKKRYGFNFLVQHVLFPPLVYLSFITRYLEL